MARETSTHGPWALRAFPDPSTVSAARGFMLGGDPRKPISTPTTVDSRGYGPSSLLSTADFFLLLRPSWIPQIFRTWVYDGAFKYLDPSQLLIKAMMTTKMRKASWSFQRKGVQEKYRPGFLQKRRPPANHPEKAPCRLRPRTIVR